MYELPLLFLLLLLAGLLLYLYTRYRALREQLEAALFSQQSQSVRHGRLLEQWIPFSKDLPFRPEDFRFLGAPIDGVAFAEDKIFFCEFKTGNGALSRRQRKIRKQVEEGRVEWLEARAKGRPSRALPGSGG